MVQINRKLNLVIPLDRQDGSIYVHSEAIGKEVFERHFMVLAKTFTQIYAQDLGVGSGPRIAYIMLRKMAEDLGKNVVQDVEATLIPEIRRLANVIMPTEDNRGWETIPYQEAVNRKLLDEDEISEVENAITFFTVVSRMHRKQDLTGVLGVMAQLWSAEIVSLNATEYQASLPILTRVENTGGKVAA